MAPPAGRLSLPPAKKWSPRSASLTSRIKEAAVNFVPASCGLRGLVGQWWRFPIPDPQAMIRDACRTGSSGDCPPEAGNRAATFVSDLGLNRENRMEPTHGVFGRARLICGLLATLVAGCITGPEDAEPVVGLITKTEDNPFFVAMREGAVERARELGVELRAFAGRFDGDTDAQVRAIESLLAADATGILITPSDPAALLDAVGRARRTGVLVIALDTPFDPPGAVDGTFATDNFRAGELIGMWARASMGVSAADARIATLDGAGTQVTVEVLRNQGFLNGFGIDIKDPDRMYDEDDPRIAGSAATMGTEEGGRAAMERLMRDDPGINVVYAINEPAAAGAYGALRGMGVDDDVLVVTIDGGCEGVRGVAAGEIGATAMQYPVRMASLGVEAVVEYARTGRTPGNTPGLDFHDTDVALVTDEPVPGVPSIRTEQGLSECWG